MALRDDGRKPAKKHRRGPGVPFVKGDPRINRGGNLNAAAQAWSINYRNKLAEDLEAEEAAKLDAEAFRKNRPGVRADVKDRLMGKANQPVEHSGEVKIKINAIIVKKVADG